MSNPPPAAPPPEPWWFEDDAVYEKFTDRLKSDKRFASLFAPAPGGAAQPTVEGSASIGTVERLVEILTKGIQTAAGHAPATSAPGAPPSPPAAPGAPPAAPAAAAPSSDWRRRWQGLE